MPASLNTDLGGVLSIFVNLTTLCQVHKFFLCCPIRWDCVTNGE